MDSIVIPVALVIGMGTLIGLEIWGQGLRRRFQAWVARQQDAQRDR